LKFILLKNKSFKENNIIIFKESLLCINSLIEILPPFFTKKFYVPLLKLIIERLSERKIQTELTMIFENMSSKTSPKEIRERAFYSTKMRAFSMILGIEMLCGQYIT
jgi:membrane protein CcdC involved in cytochrome C biogenesis